MKTKGAGIFIQNPKEKRKALKTYGPYNYNCDIFERLFGFEPFLTFPFLPRYNLAR